jgi:hypothetical protein
MQHSIVDGSNRCELRRTEMKKPGIDRLWQAGGCLLCALLTLKITSGPGESEFSGGRLTGPVHSMADVGTVLFVVACVVTFVYPRVAAVVGIAASLLCLPLYLFLLAPVPFNQIFGSGHELKTQEPPGFQWETWPVMGLLSLAVIGFLCIRRIAVREAGQG